MGGRNIKISIAVVVLLATVVWLGMSGLDEGKAYYWTTDELLDHGEEAFGRRVQLMGDLVPGSVRYHDGHLNFSLVFNDVTVPVVYQGTAPVPDTFVDGRDIQALVEGEYSREGHFVGYRIQAKCASKYEADPSAYGGRGADQARGGGYGGEAKSGGY